MPLDRNLLLKHAPSNVGQQTNINHDGCEAGVDKKRRLYIKRVEKGILGYCHHCCNHGFVRDQEDNKHAWVLASKKKDLEDVRTPLPKLGTLSLEGDLWLKKNYCDSNALHFVGILGEKQRVGVCLYDIEGNHTGYQIRYLGTDPSKPKYITHYFSNKDKGSAAWFYNQSSSTLVVCEDYLSAYRVNKDTGSSSVALLGTTIHDKLLHEINDKAHINHVIVWLDSDEAGQRGGNKAVKTLSYYLTTNVTLLKQSKEPKQCSPTELNEIINGLPSSSSLR